jgi:hypothetical protein
LGPRAGVGESASRTTLGKMTARDRADSGSHPIVSGFGTRINSACVQAARERGFSHRPANRAIVRFTSNRRPAAPRAGVTPRGVRRHPHGSQHEAAGQLIAGRTQPDVRQRQMPSEVEMESEAAHLGRHSELPSQIAETLEAPQRSHPPPRVGDRHVADPVECGTVRRGT